MNDKEKDFDEDDEFVLDVLKKSDFSKYNSKKSFEFGESTEKPDISKYEGLKSFKFGKNPQPDPYKYIGLEEFVFHYNQSPISQNRRSSIPFKSNLERNMTGEKAVIENKELIDKDIELNIKERQTFMAKKQVESDKEKQEIYFAPYEEGPLRKYLTQIKQKEKNFSNDSNKSEFESNQERNVSVTYDDWANTKKQIFKLIYECILYNKNQINKFKSLSNYSEFFENLKILIYNCLNSKSNISQNLTAKQLSLVMRFIPAVYLVTSKHPPNIQKICDASNLHHSHIDLMTEIFGVKLPKAYDIYKTLNLKRTEELSEMVSIILGDGSLQDEHGYNLTISLNRIDEPEYVEYVADLMERLFKEKPKRYPSKKGKGVRLVLYGKSLVEELKSHGLVSGDKVQNQVSVPIWIKRNTNLMIKCLKGLTDTDGNFTVDKADRMILLAFTNASHPLVKDFKSMCNSLGIETPNITPDYRQDKNVFYVRIKKRDYVKKFIAIVRPQKWNYHRNYIGMRLIALQNPEINKKIERDIKLAFPDRKQIQYSKKLEALLERLCIKYGLNISSQAIDNAINNAFEFKEFPYRKEHAAGWKTLYEQLGSFQAVRKYLELYHDLSPKWETIQKHIKIYMTEKGENYDSWFEKIKEANLRPIVIDKQGNKWIVTQFPSDLRRIIIKMIWQILIESDFNVSPFQLAQMISQDEKNPKLIRMFFLYKEPSYKQAIFDYILNLARLIQITFRLSRLSRKIRPYKLKNDPSLNLPFSRWQITEIINEIKSLYPEYFYY